MYNPSTNTLTVANVSGNASSATKLTSGYVGDWSVPVYFSNGVPAATTYLNIHPENSNSITLPFIYNDLAHLVERGGSYEIYSTTATSFTALSINKTALSVDLTNAFDGSSTYIVLNAADKTVVIDITLPTKLNYSNRFYIDFGATGWRANDISLFSINSANETSYVAKGSITNNTLAHWILPFSHESTTSSGSADYGFDKIRIVLKNWNGAQNRIA